MKDKMTILTGVGVIIAVMITLAVYVTGMLNGSIELQEYLMVFVIVVIVAAASWVMRDKIVNSRKRLPVKDERQTGISYRAGYYAWIASIWSAIGVMWFGIFLEEEFGYPQLTANYVVAGVVLISALVFFGAYFYLNRKGG